MLVLASAGPVAASAEVAGDAVQRIRSAEVLEAGELYPDALPAPGARWLPRALPDNWASTRPGQGGYVWYRLRFDGPPAGQPSAIYLPGFSMNLQLWVNGQALGTVGRMREPVSRYLYTPRLADVPAALLRPGAGANELLVLVVGYPQLRCGLGELYIGPAEPLARAWGWRYFWQHTGLQASLVVTFMLGVYLLMLWWRERSNGVFGWCGLSALVWGARNLNLLLHELPWHASLHNLDWSRVFASGEGLFVACFAMFTLRYTQDLEPALARPRWQVPLVAAFALASPAVLLLMPAAPVSWHLVTVLSLWAVGMTLWMQARLLLAAWRVRRTEPVAIAVAGLFYLVLLGHDAAVIADREQQALYLLRPYAVLPLFGAIGWLLTRRYLDALTDAQRLSATLQTEVQAQHLALERSFLRLRETERAQAQAQERERLMRDLHDGLGLHLLSALRQARAPGGDTGLLVATLQDGLDDLRMVVDSLAGDERDPMTVLGNLRYRLAPRLAAVGIRLDWQVGDDVPELPWLDAERVLQLLRIVQEALTNAVRHSGASVVTIALRRLGGQLEVSVTDNGHGGASDGLAHGRGLTNMQARASALGASLALHSGSQGTRVALGLPLQRD